MAGKDVEAEAGLGVDATSTTGARASDPQRDGGPCPSLDDVIPSSPEKDIEDRSKMQTAVVTAALCVSI